jgi:hypothetical protein
MTNAIKMLLQSGFLQLESTLQFFEHSRKW